jgi:hypothetical protein
MQKTYCGEEPKNQLKGKSPPFPTAIPIIIDGFVGFWTLISYTILFLNIANIIVGRQKGQRCPKCSQSRLDVC